MLSCFFVRQLRGFAGAVVASIALSSTAIAGAAGGALEPVSLPPITFNAAELTVVGANGATVYDAQALEALGTFRMTTRTPWRDAPAVFDGVRLVDLLAVSGLSDAEAVTVTAENDYTVTIPREVWEQQPCLIATRVNGAAHDRRKRGPLQFVFPQDAHPELGERDFEYYWVWMASRIEPAS